MITMSTTITIKKETKSRLDNHGSKNESYDTIVNRLVDIVEDTKNERN